MWYNMKRIFFVCSLALFNLLPTIANAGFMDKLKEWSLTALQIAIVGFAISSLVLYVTAKGCSIKKASYFRCLVTTFFSLVLGILLNLILSLIPIIGSVLAVFVSFIFSTVITTAIFDTSFGRAFAAELMRWVIMSVIVFMVVIASCAGVVSSFKQYMQKHETTSEKINDAKKKDKSRDDVLNNEQENKHLLDEKNKCLGKILKKYKKEGNYVSHEDGEYEKIIISLDSGEMYTTYTAMEGSSLILNNAKGKRLLLDMQKVQFWDEITGKCKVEDNCIDIAIVKNKTENLSIYELVGRFVKDKQIAFSESDINRILSFYDGDVLFYGQRMNKDKLKKNFVAYCDKWVKRSGELIKVDSINQIDQGVYEVIYDENFAHSTADGKCMSGLAKSRIVIFEVNHKYIIKEENKLSTIKDNHPQCK